MKDNLLPAVVAFVVFFVLPFALLNLLWYWDERHWK